MKRTWIKAILCLLSAVLLLAALSACGGGSRTEPNAKTEAHKTEPQPEEQTEPEQLMTILDRDGDPLGGIDGRAVCAAADGFYLLRLRLEGGSPAELLLDRYDAAGAKRSERSLNDLLIPAARSVPGLSGEADALNEFGMMVSGFSVQADRYLYYENFGLLRVVLDLEDGAALLSKDDLWCVSRGSGSPAVYRLDFDAEEEGPKVLVLQDGGFADFPIEPRDGHRLLRAVSHAQGGAWLLQLSDSDKAYAGSEILCWLQEP